MFTPIHRALGLEPGNLTIELIMQAVEHGVEERNDLDWKRSLYNRKNQKWQEEAAKDIAAMANSGGGWIIFGVGEEGANNSASQIHPVEWSAGEQQRIIQVAYAMIGPPVVGLDFIELPCSEDEDSGSVVAMRIPDSRDAPHFARKGDGAFTAPWRSGPHTVFMSDREIERGFRERFQYANEREQLLEDQFGHAREALSPEKGVFLAVAALPLNPVSSRKPLSMETVASYRNRDLLPDLLRENASGCWTLGEIRKGLRQWIWRSDSNPSALFRKCLCDDGKLLGSYQLGLLDDRGTNYRLHLSEEVNHCMSKHLEIAVLDFITLLRSHAQERQANGGFRIRAGLVGVADEPIYIRTTEPFGNILRNVEHSEPIRSFQPVTTDLDPLADVADMLAIVNDLALDLINQGGVRYLEVVRNPHDPVE